MKVLSHPGECMSHLQQQQKARGDTVVQLTAVSSLCKVWAQQEDVNQGRVSVFTTDSASCGGVSSARATYSRADFRPNAGFACASSDS